jgi:MoaA/NifB/PqqE/SkfB family radical SAM enzyme
VDLAFKACAFTPDLPVLTARLSLRVLDMRDLDLYEGKCGRCEFIRVCGGCRARAYEATGNYLAEEPLCIYEPGKAKQSAIGDVRGNG